MILLISENLFSLPANNIISFVFCLKLPYMHDLQACKNQLKYCNPITDFFMSQNVSDIDC